MERLQAYMDLGVNRFSVGVQVGAFLSATSLEAGKQPTTTRPLAAYPVQSPLMQAFQREMLEVCGRSHSLNDVYAALTDIRATGPVSWSLDLICGLPGLTAEVW